MTRTRQPAVAGTFYPADPGELAAAVDALLDDVAPYDDRGTPADEPFDDVAPVALVVPHAGYVYSGPVAASGYARLRHHGDEIGTVAVLGPSHFAALRGLAIPSSGGFATPLGRVPVDTAACTALVERDLAARSDAPHAIEHSLEVQLPFLQRCLIDGWTCIPVAVGPCSPALVADAVDALAPDLVVVSTDLSHYLDQASATSRDCRTAEEVVARRPEMIGSDDACGVHPLRGLLEWTRRHDHRVELVDLRTSADTAGTPERVVGYGAFVVTSSD